MKYKVKYYNHISNRTYTLEQAKERVDYLNETFKGCNAHMVEIKENENKRMNKSIFFVTNQDFNYIANLDNFTDDQALTFCDLTNEGYTQNIYAFVDLIYEVKKDDRLIYNGYQLDVIYSNDNEVWVVEY